MHIWTFLWNLHNTNCIIIIIIIIINNNVLLLNSGH